MIALDDSEVKALTRRVRPTAQARVLKDSGIPYRMVSGRPVVARDALIDTLQGGRSVAGPKLRLSRA